MNPRQKMNEKDIHGYNMRMAHHNFNKFDKLEAGVLKENNDALNQR